MSQLKKYILSFLVALLLPTFAAYAATPTLSATGSGDGSNVTVTVNNGGIQAPVVLFYTTGDNMMHTFTIGMTDTNGTFTGSLNTNTLGINSTVPIYVQVGGYQSNAITWPYSTTATSSTSTVPGIMFSVSNPSLNVGQTGTLTLSGGNGTYYVSNNSNTGVITPTISGNTLTYYGAGSGTSTVTICSVDATLCGTTLITSNTPGTASSTSSSITFSPSMTNLMMGQSGQIQISGGNAPYTLYTTSGNGVSTSLSGNMLTVNGLANGTTTFNVCSANNLCSPLSITVGASQMASSTATGPGFTISLAANDIVKLTMNNGNGSGYYLQSSVAQPFMASVSGNVLTVSGSTFGTATITVCQNGTSSMCMPITFVVDRAATTPVAGTGSGYVFVADLWSGTTSDAVTQLQNILIARGYLNATATGHFGPLTLEAVKKFQTAKGISATGYVGALTRAALNLQ